MSSARLEVATLIFLSQPFWTKLHRSILLWSFLLVKHIILCIQCLKGPKWHRSDRKRSLIVNTISLASKGWTKVTMNDGDVCCPCCIEALRLKWPNLLLSKWTVGRRVSSTKDYFGPRRSLPILAKLFYKGLRTFLPSCRDGFHGDVNVPHVRPTDFGERSVI